MTREVEENQENVITSQEENVLGKEKSKFRPLERHGCEQGQ